MPDQFKLYLAIFIPFVFIICLLIVFWALLSSRAESQESRTQYYDTAFSQNQAAETATITMFNPTTAQTDSTPLITASGQQVRRGIAANNCLPFGAKVVIFGETYEIQDRMNDRYGCDKYDILTFSEKEAWEWGRRVMPVKILEN